MNDPNCLFCKIAAGEISCYKIHETDKFLAFLDVLPLTPGHTLVIPKQHFRWVWDVQPVGEYFEVITKVANHFRKVLNQDLLVSMTLGEAVPHAHYHLIPQHPNLDQVLENYSQLKSKEMIAKEEGEEMMRKLSVY